MLDVFAHINTFTNGTNPRHPVSSGRNLVDYSLSFFCKVFPRLHFLLSSCMISSPSKSLYYLTMFSHNMGHNPPSISCLCVMDTDHCVPLASFSEPNVVPVFVMLANQYMLTLIFYMHLLSLSKVQLHQFCLRDWNYEHLVEFRSLMVSHFLSLRACLKTAHPYCLCQLRWSASPLNVCAPSASGPLHTLFQVYEWSPFPFT